MPMRSHHAQQTHPHRVQHEHQQRTPCSTTSERGGFAGSFADRATSSLSTSHDSSNDDDGETSSASEDSAASSTAEDKAGCKRFAEPSASFRLPPSRRSRTTTSPPLQQPGCLPVSRGGTLETGSAAAPASGQPPRQLPRLAALENLLSTHDQQQQQQQQQPELNVHSHQRSGPSAFQQQQPHHHQDFPLGPQPPTTRVGSRTNATVQLPSLLRAAKSSAPSAGSLSSSAASSPACSPGLRATSPPYGGRYELPSPACTQGVGAGSGGGGSVKVNQRWLAGTSGTSAHRRHVPRIDALSPTKDGHGAALSRAQLWQASAAALDAPQAGTVASAAGAAMSRWPKHSGDGRRGVLSQTTFPYSHSGAGAPPPPGYIREMDEEKSNPAWGRQHGGSSVWPVQRHHLHQQHQEVTQHPSDTAAPPSATRTPSPLSLSSSRHGHEHACRPHQHHQQQDSVLSGASSSFGSRSTSTPTPSPSASSASPETRSWTPPALASGVGSRPGLAVAGNVHRGKWDEEAQANASGSVGKQILQRYLSHLYPKASREVWSHDEEEVLWRAQKEYGNAWGYISSLLPGRSENAVKNHWYTQMRMFIGQRVNNSSSSKPCPPPSARTASSKAAGGKGTGRQNKRKPEDHRIDAPKQQQQQQTPPPSSPSECGDETESNPSSSINVNTTNNPDPAPPATPTAVKPEEVFADVHEEKQARADAVAALGMLFSQRATSGAASVEERRQR
eukprot:g15645.t1